MQHSLTEREQKLSRAKQLLLEKRLRGETPSGVALRPISPSSRPKAIPLSYAQERLWFIDLLEDGASPEYNVPAALRLRGELDRHAMERAVNTIVARHESLRTRFSEVEGEPVQIIEPELHVPLSVVDFSGFEESERREKALEALQKEREQAFDLRRGPVIRVKLLKLGDRDHVLLRTVHHIVSDGWSEGVFNRELGILYDAYREGKENPLKALEVQYADFTLWQRTWMGQGRLEEGLKYWKKQLEGIPESLELPTDRPRPSLQTFEAEACQVFLTEEQFNGLKRLSQENQATLYMTLLTCLGVVLSRYSGQDDLVVGSLIANRQHAQLDPMIGFFLNVLAMRMRVGRDDSFLDLLRNVRHTTLEAYQYQDVSFARLVEEIAPERSLNRTPIFQAMFTLQNAPREADRLGGLEVERVVGRALQVRYDIEGHVWELKGQMLLHWVYNRGLFDRWRILQMMRQHVRVLELAIENPNRKLVEISLLSTEETHQILEEWNNTYREIADDTLLDVFEAQAEQTPDSIALGFEGRVVSYRQLNERANCFARHLIALGIGPEDLIGIYLERSPEMLVSILGTLKAGAAYLPLDLAYPAERTISILDDARPMLVVCAGSLRTQLPDSATSGIVVLQIDDPQFQATMESVGSRNPSQNERRAPLFTRHPAYVIYTSGSTGRPKGVLVEHRGMLNHLIAKIEDLKLTRQDAVAQTATFAFDIAVWQMLAALMVGGRVEIVNDEIARDGLRLLEEIGRSPVTVLEIVPSLLVSMLEAGSGKAWPELRHTVSTGEALPVELCLRWRNAVKGGTLWNAYGPTECSDDVTHYRLEYAQGGDFERMEGSAGTAPIGKPICNTRAYVFDRFLQPAPIGVPGELYIAGVGLARGYLKRPGLTAERFIADPLGKSGMRMYRTGDLVRLQVDGNIQYLGRTDHQVKVRGFRIELGDIENALQKAGAREAVVIVHERGDGEKSLIAYVVLQLGMAIDKIEMQTELAHSLPNYMVPSAIVVLDALPLLPNGKVDRKSLPVPNYGEIANTYRAPRTPEEEILCALFAEVLGLERVGIDGNFFELGGHSLMATRIVSRIRAALGSELPIRTVFESPTPAELGTRLREAGVRRIPLVRQPRPESLPLSYAQERMWFLDRLDRGASAEYNMHSALRLRGDLDCQAMERAVNTIVERHESLRTHVAEAEGEPVQIIESELKIPLTVLDFSGLEEAERREKALEALKEEKEKIFDLKRGPVLRVKLLKLGERDYVLLRTVHHIVSDGWSEGVFNRELDILYRAYQEGKENPLKPLDVQYADFTLWQRQWMDKGKLEEGLKYWKKQLEAIPESLELPTERSRPPMQTFEAEACTGLLSEEQVRGLRKLSQENQATLYMTLLAALGVLLSRYSGQDDLVLGSPIANRQDAQLDPIIGFFSNTLAMRIRVQKKETFQALLQNVRATTLEAYQHQDISFAHLVGEIAPIRKLDRMPVFQAVLALQNAPWQAQQMKGLEIEPLGAQSLRVRFDLEVHVWEAEEKIRMYWLYNRHLFAPGQMEQMLRHFIQVLDGIVADSRQPIDRLMRMADSERLHVLSAGSKIEDVSPGESVFASFEKRVERNPQAIAVSFASGEWSYLELNERANRLAHYLRKRGVGLSSWVAVCMEDSHEFLCAALGVIKAGAAYVHLDRRDPRVWHQESLAKAGWPLLLIKGTIEGIDRTELATLFNRAIDLDREKEEITLESAANPAVSVKPDATAYVTYGSGRWIEIDHKRVSVRLRWLQEKFGLQEQDSVLYWEREGLERAVVGGWWPLMRGARITAMKRGADSKEVAEAIGEQAVSVAQLSHQFWSDILRMPDGMQGEALSALRSLRLMLSEGQSLPKAVEEEILPRLGGTAYHSYVPAQAGMEIAVTKHGKSGERIDGRWIGETTGNLDVYLLDEMLEPVPFGVRGEIYVGDPRERTEADKAAAIDGGSLSHTGDIGRWREPGRLEVEEQGTEYSWIREQRISLREVEAALLEEESVSECAVFVRVGPDGERCLMAYVVAAGLSCLDDLAAQMHARLPAWMQPTGYVPVAALPLNARGEIDLARLERIPLVEGRMLARWERWLKEREGVGKAAVIAHEYAPEITRLHLGDAIGGWKAREFFGEDVVRTEREPDRESRNDVPRPLALADGGPLVIPQDAPTTLTEALLRTAERHSEKGILYVSTQGERHFLSYGALLENARRILGGMQARGLKAGDRVILQCEWLPDHFGAFWACVMGGIIPVNVAVPHSYRERNAVVNKLYNVWKLLKWPTMIAGTHLQEGLDDLQRLFPPSALEGEFIVLPIQDLKTEGGFGKVHESNPEDVVFLQLTSGSTGTPKCIQESHRAIIAHIHGSAQFNGHTKDDVALNWLPIDHVVPTLMINLKDVYMGCQEVQVAASLVLADPLRWLDLMQEERVTHSWAPNFAFKLVAERLAAQKMEKQAKRWDLSHVKCLMNAGEQVTPAVVSEFQKLTEDSGLRASAMQPAYGMAEVCTAMTYANDFDIDKDVRWITKASIGGWLGEASAGSGESIGFVTVGLPIPGVQIRITDGNNRTQPEGKIGRLQIKGEVVMRGYLYNDEANQEVFVGDGWFNSGDLAFIWDGRLTVTGREKEVIIIRGANFYAYEIEDVVNAIEGVLPTFSAAVSVSDRFNGSEGLAIVFVAARKEMSEKVRLAQEIRRTVGKSFGINPAVIVPLEEAEFCKTTSGKIQRNQMKKLLEEGKYAGVLKEMDLALANDSTVPGWFYEKVWRRKRLVSISGGAKNMATLVFLDAQGLGEHVCSRLRPSGDLIDDGTSGTAGEGRSRANGDPCIIIERGEEFERVNARRYRVHFGKQEHYRRLFETLVDEDMRVGQILDLGMYGEGRKDSREMRKVEGIEETAEATEAAIGRMLDVIRGLEAGNRNRQRIRLLVAASRSLRVEAGDQVDCALSPVVALLKTAGQEMPWLEWGYVDLEGENLEIDAELVSLELGAADKDQERAWRRGIRWIPRLRRLQFDAKQMKNQPPLKRGGLYLLTGGLGGIGQHVARYLLKVHEARLLLVGRTAIEKSGAIATGDGIVGGRSGSDENYEKANAIEELRSLGMVRYEAADVCNVSRLKEAVVRAESEWNVSLAGVIHLAGEYLEGMLSTVGKEEMRGVLQSKVQGALTLSRLLENHSGAIFLSFGSVNGYFGGFGVGLYAAANAFLDSFIEDRRSRGLRSYCLNWSIWDDTGMSRRLATKGAAQARGYYAIEPQQGVDSMIAALSQDWPQAFIGLNGSKEAIRRHCEGEELEMQMVSGYVVGKEGCEEIPELQSELPRDWFGNTARASLQRIEKIPVVDGREIDWEELRRLGKSGTIGPRELEVPRTEMERRIAHIWQELLNRRHVGLQDNFFDLGGHSLLAMRVVARVQEATGRNVELGTLFASPTLKSFVQAIGEKALEGNDIAAAAMSN